MRCLDESQWSKLKLRFATTTSGKSRYLLALFLACAPLGALAAARTIRLTDFRTLLSITSPLFSPDGKQIAFVTERPDFQDDRYDATLRVIDVDGGHSRVLAHGMRNL